MAWYVEVKRKLAESGLFSEIVIMGAKVRAYVSETLFLEIYHDPATKSYSYGLVNLSLPYEGDKRIFGWDDYPHEGVMEMKKLKSYPHHFQRREGEDWIFEDSPMRGNVVGEIDSILKKVSAHLKKK